MPSFNPQQQQQQQRKMDKSVDAERMKNAAVKREWQDVTNEFFESIQELEVGELMHVFLFGLFEAMSAIEMMDPKMDAGMLCNKESTPLTFERAVALEQLKLDDLDYREMIGVMDGAYACLVSWLEGQSLAQTLFTCLYLHRPMEVRDKRMKAFAVGMLKIVGAIVKLIMSVKVYEEEDFQSSTYDYDLLKNMTLNEVLTLFREAEEDLIKGAPDEFNPSDEIQAVMSRLKFTRFFLHVLFILEPKPNSETTEPVMNEIVRLLNAGLELVPTIKRTIPIGTPAEANSDAPNPIGFSPMVNQRLLPPTFPRYTKFKDRLTCIAYMEELVQRIKLACKVIHCTNYHSALNFFLEFSKKAGACLLSRSILQFLYFRDSPNSNKIFGRVDINEMLKQSVSDFIAPPVLIAKHPLAQNQLARECVDSFFFYNEHTFVLFLDICGYNRARQRDKLARLLDNFANLQDEAERVDAYLQSFADLASVNLAPKHLACFGTWVLYHCLRAMSLYLLSGLELELYSVHEYPYIFW